MDRTAAIVELEEVVARLRAGEIDAFVCLDLKVKAPTVIGNLVTFYFANDPAWRALLDGAANLSAWAARELNAKGAA